jgi:hypothetical protein
VGWDLVSDNSVISNWWDFEANAGKNKKIHIFVIKGQ